jgi:hypothetical protein
MNAKAQGIRNVHSSIRILEAAIRACTRTAASLGARKVIGIASADVVLMHVTKRDWPSTVVAARSSCCDPVHRWRDRQRVPDVKGVQ